jgi:hypothetical protein
MSRATSSTPTGVERHICTGGSGIVLKRLRDQRIGLMHLFDMSANLGVAKIRVLHQPAGSLLALQHAPLPWFNLAINILTGVAAPAFHANRWSGPKGVYTHRTSH